MASKPMVSRAMYARPKLTVRVPGECCGRQRRLMNGRRGSKAKRKPWTFAGSELMGLYTMRLRLDRGPVETTPSCCYYSVQRMD